MAKRENIFVYNFTGKCYDIGDKYGVCHTGYMFIEWCCFLNIEIRSIKINIELVTINRTFNKS